MCEVMTSDDEPLGMVPVISWNGLGIIFSILRVLHGVIMLILPILGGNPDIQKLEISEIYKKTEPGGIFFFFFSKNLSLRKERKNRCSV